MHNFFKENGQKIVRYISRKIALIALFKPLHSNSTPKNKLAIIPLNSYSIMMCLNIPLHKC